MLSNNSTEALPAIDVFEYYYVPILVFLGSLGNCVSIYVILKTKLRKLSSSCYLIALLVSDTIFLLMYILVWLSMVDINIYHTPIICPSVTYMSTVCSCLSVWLVLAFTVERFVAVMYPLKSKFICTVSRAKIIIIILILITLIIYLPMLIFASVEYDNITTKPTCLLNQDYKSESYYFNFFDTAITLVIPATAITTLNTCISKNIWKFANVRKKMTNSHHLEDLGGSTPKVPDKLRNKSCYNLTKMLLVVSTVYLIINLPSYVIRILAFIIEMNEIKMENETKWTFYTVHHCAQILFMTNFGINFILYCISGQNFRKCVLHIFCGRDIHCRGGIGRIPDNRTQSTQSTVSSGYKKRRIPTLSSEQEFAV